MFVQGFRQELCTSLHTMNLTDNKIIDSKYIEMLQLLSAEVC